MFHVTDWYATLLTLAGSDPTELKAVGIDGMDQMKAITSKGANCPSEKKGETDKKHLLLLWAGKNLYAAYFFWRDEAKLRFVRLFDRPATKNLLPVPPQQAHLQKV